MITCYAFMLIKVVLSSCPWPINSAPSIFRGDAFAGGGCWVASRAVVDCLGRIRMSCKEEAAEESVERPLSASILLFA